MKYDEEILDAQYWLLDTPIPSSIENQVSSIASNFNNRLFII